MRSLITLVAAIAVCALSAAGASARTTPPFGPGARGITVIVDTLGGNGHPRQAPAPSRAFVTDTLGGNGGGGAVSVPPSGTGFSWGDAGVGAAGTGGILLALLGGTLLVVRRRGRLAM
jgi:hypothetical protein